MNKIKIEVDNHKTIVESLHGVQYYFEEYKGMSILIFKNENTDKAIKHLQELSTK